MELWKESNTSANALDLGRWLPQYLLCPQDKRRKISLYYATDDVNNLLESRLILRRFYTTQSQPCSISFF